MAEENNKPPSDGGKPEGNNVPPEVLNQITEQLNALSEKFQTQDNLNSQLVNALQNMNQQRQQKQEADLEESFYDMNPKQYESRIRQKVERDVEAKIEAKLARQNQNQAKIAELNRLYPEVTDTTSDMYKKVIAFHDSLPKSLQNTPEGYELATSKAATALGLLPANMRDADSGFSMSSSKGAGPSKSKRDEKLDERVIETAKMLGVDTSDPKVVEQLKEYTNRSDWTRYK